MNNVKRELFQVVKMHSHKKKSTANIILNGKILDACFMHVYVCAHACTRTPTQVYVKAKEQP